jgi:hypothetical protein
MEIVKPIQFDIENSSTTGFEYQLVFTSGIFDDNNLRIQTEPVVYRIKKSDYKDITVPVGYHFMYNPRYNKFTLLPTSEYESLDECHDYGISIGGFVIMKYENKCRLSFVYPKCETTKSIRPFSDSFDTYIPDEKEGAIEGRDIPCDPDFVGELCAAFNTLNFDDSYEIKCPITESEATNSFDYCEFEDVEFETQPSSCPKP